MVLYSMVVYGIIWYGTIPYNTVHYHAVQVFRLFSQLVPLPFCLTLSVLKQYRVATISTQVINIRSGPRLEHGVITTATQGKSFQVISEQDGWIQVQFGDSTAWLFAELVTLTTSGDDLASQPTPQPVDALKMASAFADLELARAVATKAFSPPDPEFHPVCISQLEGMRNALWLAQLARDATKIRRMMAGPWEQIR